MHVLLYACPIHFHWCMHVIQGSWNVSVKFTVLDMLHTCVHKLYIIICTNLQDVYFMNALVGFVSDSISAQLIRPVHLNFMNDQFNSLCTRCQHLAMEAIWMISSYWDDCRYYIFSASRLSLCVYACQAQAKCIPHSLVALSCSTLSQDKEA